MDKSRFSPTFIVLGWPDKIVKSYYGVLHIIRESDTRYILRNNRGESPCEMGVSFQTQQEAEDEVERLLKRPLKPIPNPFLSRK